MTPSPSVSQRAANGRGLSLVDPQDSLFDRVIEDADLEEALEAREAKRIIAADKKADFTAKADVAKAKLDALGGVEVGETVRCGRFRISCFRVGANSVSFETGARNQMRIGAIAED